MGESRARVLEIWREERVLGAWEDWKGRECLRESLQRRGEGEGPGQNLALIYSPVCCG